METSKTGEDKANMTPSYHQKLIEIQILLVNQSKNHLHLSDTCHHHCCLLSGRNLLYDTQLRTLCYLSDKHPSSQCKLIPGQNPSCKTNMILVDHPCPKEVSPKTDVLTRF